MWGITNRADAGGAPGGDLGPLRYLAGPTFVEQRDFVTALELAIGRARAAQIAVPTVIFFVHGYNCTWPEALAARQRIADHFADHERQPIVVLCSWPSEGNALAYIADLGEVGAASLGFVEALGHAVDLAVERAPSGACPTQLVLMGHSMGCQVLAHVARGLWRNLGEPAAAPIFAETILMGADLDNNALEIGCAGEGLVRLSRRVTIYRNSGDQVLGLSSAKRLRATGPRLGREGVPRRDRLSSAEAVVEVDCTGVAAEGAPGGQHSFYLYDEGAVRRDLRQVVAGVSKALIGGRRKVRDGVYKLAG